ncbi:hypothetical protein CLOM_g4624, partial [Closterium sp. NIES-68]
LPLRPQPERRIPSTAARQPSCPVSISSKNRGEDLGLHVAGASSDWCHGIAVPSASGDIGPLSTTFGMLGSDVWVLVCA